MAIKITNLDAIRGSGVKNPEALRQNWYSGDTPSTRDILGRISEIYDHNKLAGTFYANQFFKLQQDSSSSFYDPYASATNKAVSELASYGVDTSVIDDQFFRNNDYLREYLNYNGSTNTPSAPGKKASVAEKAAYAYYQIWKSEDKTKKAEEQWNSLQNELSYWAKYTDRNYSDDEIIDKVDWSKYGELTSMETNKLMQPNEYNRAIGYSRDAMYGVIWAARNGGGTGNLFSDIAMSARGKGNVWQENPEITAKLEPLNPDGTINADYHPYSVGSTIAYDDALFFGIYGADDQWLEEKKRIKYYGTDEEKKHYANVEASVSNQHATETAESALYDYAEYLLNSCDDPNDVKKNIDKALANGKLYVKTDKNGNVRYSTKALPGYDAVDLGILNDIDASVGKNMGKENQTDPTCNLVPLSKGTNYRYDNLMTDIDKGFEQKSAKKKATEYASGVAAGASAKAPAVPAEGVDAVSGADRVYKPGQQDAVIEAQDKVLGESADIVAPVATEAEYAGIKNSWSTAYGIVKNVWDTVISAINPNSAIMANLVKTSVGTTTSAVLKDSEIVHQYNIYRGKLPELEKEKTELEAELGNLAYKKDEAFDYDKWDGKLESQPAWNTLDEGQKEKLKDYESVLDVQDLANMFNTEVNKVAVTEEQQERINRYQNVLFYLDEANGYMEQNQDAYDAAVKRTEDEKRKTNIIISMLKRNGVDTTELENAQTMGDFYLQFNQYDPTVWSEYNVYHEYSKIVYSGAGGIDEMLEIAQNDDDEIQKNIELAQWALDYADENNIQLPDNIRENIMRWMESMQRQHEDFEYLSVLNAEDFGEQAKKGRQMAADMYEFDWDAYKENPSLEAQPMWNLLSDEQKQSLLQMQEIYDINDVANQFTTYMNDMDIENGLFGSYRLSDLLTDYETDTFYYLLATEGLEGAMTYKDHLTDSSYGVLNSRAATKTRENADELASSGFFGRRAADLLSALLSPVAAVKSFVYTADYALKKLRGERVELNPENIDLTANIYKKEARQKINEEIDRVYGKDTLLGKVMGGLQEIISNRLDSAADMLAFGPLFSGISSEILQEFMGALPMAYAAATDAVSDAKAKGANDTQMLGIFLSTLLSESVTEAISISNIRDAFKMGLGNAGAGDVAAFLKNWLTNSGISEMVGESINDVVENLAADLWTPDSSEYKELVAHYINDEHMTEEEARDMAGKDMMMGLLHTALISYLSPGMDIVSYSAGRLKGLASMTREYQQAGYNDVNVFNVMQYDKQRRQNEVEALRTLIDESRNATGEQATTGEQTAAAEQLAAQNAEAPVESVNIVRPDTGAPETTQEAPQVQGDILTVNAPENTGEAVNETVSVDRYAADYTALDSATQADTASQTATIASVLDMEKTNESGDMATAAAERLDTLPGGEDRIELMTDLVVGAEESQTDLALVKQAVMNAVLGGEQSAAWQMMNSSEYIHADLGQKAALLASTVEQDAANAAVQESIAKEVHESRVNAVERDLIANGALKGTQKAQASLDKAEKVAADARASLEEKQQALEQAAADVEQKAQAVAENPTDDNMKQHMDAVTRMDNADESLKQYKQHMENAEQDRARAEAEFNRIRNEEMTAVRKQAEETVAQQDQQRANEAAEKAEQQRKQEEAAAKAKAEQDERTGKADEDRRNALIEEALDRENLQGEKRETRREQLKKQLDKVKIKITDLGKSVSNTEGRLALYAFERKLGVPIVFDDLGPVNSKHITRGQYVYNEKTGEAKIVINENLIKAGKMTVGQAIVEAALHEVLHSVRATGAYNTYRHVVTKALYGNNSNLDPTELYKQNIAYRAAIDDMIADRKAAGDKNFQDDVKLEDKINLADEEIVADFARLNLADKDVVQRFMDAGMGGKMRNILHNINQALKNYGEKISGKRYEQWKAQTEQQNREIEQWNAEHPDQQRELIDIKSREEFNRNLEYLRRAERAYQKAMEEAAKTNIHPNSNMMSVSQIAESTKLGMVVNEDRLELYMPSENGDIIGDGTNGLEKGKRYVLMDGVTPGKKITADMIVNTPVGMLIDMGLDNTEFTDEQGNKRTQQGDARQMFADLMNLCARYKDNNLIWEIAGSEFSEAFSALKSNSDPQYKNTVDFGTICSKTQAIVDVLSQTMVDRVNAIRQWNEEHAAEIEAGTAEKRIFTGLTREDIMEVYDRTHNAGLSVPCPVCYVFSRWMGVPGMLGQMNRFQNEYVVLAKGEDGKTLYDENGDAVVNWDETFEKANGYLLDMVREYTKTKDNPAGIDITDPNLTTEERNAAIKAAKDKIADQKNSINNKIRSRQKSIPKLYEEIGILQEKLENQDLTDRQRQKIEEQIKKKEETAKKKDREIDQFEEDKKKFEAFNWVSQVLCLQHTEGKATINDLDENGNFVMDKENFRYTPEEILFDLNRSGEFAGYAKNWRYRTTRGAGMGKAIMPYSGASIGDIIHGEALRWREGQNPLLNMDKAAAEKAFKSAQKRVKQQNLVGGQRFQSTSDFRPEWGLDYIMSFLEMQALGSKVQMYTKVAEAVDFLGSIGADVNLSIMAKNNGYHIATDEEIALSQQDTDEGRELKSRMGIANDENGDSHLYVMEFSDVTGMDYATAKGKSKKFNNVQMILVGMNDVHIRLALGNQDIDFVIPWHSSGNSKDVLQQLVSSVGEQLLESSDYTDTQTDQIKSHKEGKGKNEKTIDDRTQDEIKLWDARVKLLTEGGEALTQEERQTLMSNDITRELYRRFTEQGYDPDCYGVTLTKDQAEQVFPYEYWDKTSTRENADVNGQRFVEYCDALGLVPRFSQFKDVPGYWKLLIDRKMYDNNVLNDDGTVKEYGKYRDQKVVDVTKARMDNDPNQALDPATDRKKQVYQLPESTTAKYGRKQYKQETENAIRAANEYLSEKYDGHTMNSMYGDLTAADRDLMTDTVNDYEDAVARQDWKAAQEDVDFYAEQKGYADRAYHGTPRFGFTQFDTEDGNGAIFVSYNPELAGTYTHGTQRMIRENVDRVEYDPSNPEYLMSIVQNKDEKIKYKTDKGWWNITGISQNDDGTFNIQTRGNEYTITGQELAQTINENREIKQFGLGGVYQLYTRPGNQLVIDAQGNEHSNIPVDWSDKAETTNTIAQYAKEHGYDSVRINNVYDPGGHAKQDSENYGDIGIFFNQDDVKSADPVTYDDNGNVIPLDQRFSDSPDIRYSTKGELSAADRDLMEEQELNQTLAESGALTAEEVAAYEERYHKRPLEGRRATEGEAQRAFGDVGGMLEKSDEIASFAKSVVKAQNTYFPDTNFDQINRAVDWIKSQNGGYAEALEKVTSDSFDYRSADGQARMVAMMGLAAAKNDVIAQASLADAFNRQGTDLGRALQARKLFMLMTPEGRKSTLRKMLQNAKDEMGKQGKNVDLTFSEWIYEAAAAAETQEDMRLVQQAALASLGEQLPSNWKDRLNSIRMLSMLANPRTHIRNIIGNAMFIPAVSLKNKLGAVMELGVKQGEKTKALKPIASKEARAFAREDAETIKGLLTGEAKYSEAAQIKQNQAPLGQFMKVLSDLNSNFLESEDWFFLKGHYRRALSGWMEANGYTANQLREDQALLEKGRAYAINEAQKATYRDFSKTAQILNSVSRKGGLPGFIVDAALPFKKTPANILRRGIEYSPAGIVKSLSYDLVKMKQYLDYQNGKLDVLPEKALSPTQVIDHICSGLSGTAITALGFLLAGSGAVSCGLDDDEDKFEKAKGNQEYAIKAKLFGHDVTFTLDWAAPMSMPFFVGAAVREQMEKEGNVNVEDAFNAFGGILEPVFNLSMLDGINTLFKTSSYDSNSNPIMQIFEKIATNYVSSFVPSALGAVARTIDDTKRKSFVPSDQSKGFVGNLRYAHENAQNKIPFYNQQNIPVRDIWGNEDRTGFVERLLENFILPGYINEYKEDPIINEMARLYEATGDKSMIPQADPDKTISYTVKSTKEKVKHVLTDKEWDKYKEVRGKTAFTELTELMGNEDYQNASTATQVQMIKDIWSHANDVGKKAVIPDIDLNDPVETSVGTIAKDSKIASTKNEMIKALNARDYDAYDTMVQALYDEGLEESDVKAKIRDYYREQYKDAYRKKMKDRISEIEEILDNTGIDFDELIDGWKEAVDDEQP